MNVTPNVPSKRLITFHDGEALDPADPEVQAYLAQAVVIPPGPRCERCEHPMCPCCLFTCDRIVWSDDGTDFDCCCNGACDIDRFEAATWAMKIEAAVAHAAKWNLPTAHASGPFEPHNVRTLRSYASARAPRDPAPPCGDPHCIFCLPPSPL